MKLSLDGHLFQGTTSSLSALFVFNRFIIFIIFSVFCIFLFILYAISEMKLSKLHTTCTQVLGYIGYIRVRVYFKGNGSPRRAANFIDFIVEKYLGFHAMCDSK